jgi:hypothetical protein
MNSETDFLNNLPLFYSIGVGFLLYLVLEAIYQRKRKIWIIPALSIYLTTGVWYFAELLYTPEEFTQFSRDIVELGYLQVLIFLVSYRILVPSIVHQFVHGCLPQPQKLYILKLPKLFQPDRVLVYISIVWIVLLVCGIIRLNGDIVGALFPIQSRTGTHMWGRAAGADAGATGFIVSSASYTYLLVCAFFGILLPLQTKPSFKFLNLILLCISLPYYIFMGARNQFLAAAVPGIISYFLFSRNKPIQKILILFILIFSLNFVLEIIIKYRNLGFSSYFANLDSNHSTTFVKPEKDENQKHLGLNMMQELCYINTFLQEKSLKLSYGGRYLAELANIIPRAIWSNKPLVGIDYAILRGFGSSSNDIGVFATISTGFLGQGVVNFGSDLGPIAPGFLMALWTGFLSRLWVQRYSTLRKCLFLVGLGLTFNLGRDITLLVLWPIIFGSVLVKFLEKIGHNPPNGSRSSVSHLLKNRL